MRQWCAIILIGLLAGLGCNVNTSGPQPNKSQSGTGQDSPTTKTSGEAKLMPKTRAEPAILAYSQEELHGGPSTKIEYLSDPMEPDKKHANLYREFGATAYYVTTSVSSKYTPDRVIHRSIMWVGMRDGNVTVHGYRDIDAFEKEADKEWLAKHPIPK